MIIPSTPILSSVILFYYDNFQSILYRVQLVVNGAHEERGVVVGCRGDGVLRSLVTP